MQSWSAKGSQGSWGSQNSYSSHKDHKLLHPSWGPWASTSFLRTTSSSFFDEDLQILTPMFWILFRYLRFMLRAPALTFLNVSWWWKSPFSTETDHFRVETKKHFGSSQGFWTFWFILGDLTGWKPGRLGEICVVFLAPQHRLFNFPEPGPRHDSVDLTMTMTVISATLVHFTNGVQAVRSRWRYWKLPAGATFTWKHLTLLTLHPSALAYRAAKRPKRFSGTSLERVGAVNSTLSC